MSAEYQIGLGSMKILRGTRSSASTYAARHAAVAVAAARRERISAE